MAGNMSSRLFKNLRLNHGLTYNVSIDANEYEKHGIFCILTSVDNKKVLDYTVDKIKKPGAISVIADTISDLIKNGVTETEIVKAKGYVKGQLTLSSENALNISDYNGKLVLLDRSHFIPFHKLYDLKYKNITKNQVNRIINKYFKKDRLSIYLIGPESSSKLKDSVTILSNIYEK